MQAGTVLFAIIADEDTVTSFILAGIGNSEKRKKQNFLIVNSKTHKSNIEEAFVDFTSRKDTGILLITQDVAELIRPLLDNYDKLVPTVLEIPSKDHPYDLAKDGVMQRVEKLLGM